jgi:RNA polymerase sigma-70 factor (ECF subfamily)
MLERYRDQARQAGQAAQVLGCSRATFLVRLHRARKRFAQVVSAQSAVAPSPSTPRRVTDEQRVATAG